MFLQSAIVQLAIHIMFLWIFGNTIEDSMGPVRFIVFYLLGGIAALAVQIAISPDSHVPTIGSAGAIAAGLITPTDSGSAIAYFAYVGGFVFGLATIKLFATKRTPTPPTRVVA